MTWLVPCCIFLFPFTFKAVCLFIKNAFNHRHSILRLQMFFFLWLTNNSLFWIAKYHSTLNLVVELYEQFFLLQICYVKLMDSVQSYWKPDMKNDSLKNRWKSIQLYFLWKVVRQNDTNVTSRSMQLKKGGCELLREANRS